MIVSRHDGQLLVVRQPDHGLQVGAFAGCWGNEDVPGFEGRAAVVRAALVHDDGWAAWEREPSLDPGTGQPWHFFELPLVEHVPLYRWAVDRAAEVDPYSGLLVSLHGVGLYNGRFGSGQPRPVHGDGERAARDAFLSEQADLQRLLGAPSSTGTDGSLGDGPLGDGALSLHYRLLQVWDRLSLQYVWQGAGDGDITFLPRSTDRTAGGPGPRAGADDVLRCRNDGAMALRLDPWPFADSPLVFPVEARRVADRRYASGQEFAEELAAAAPVTLECRARPC